VSARSRFLTSAEVARWVGCSPWSVRWMARTGQLAHETTEDGQYLFHREDVKRFNDRRGEARYRGVKVLRPKRFGVPGQPQQLSMWWIGRPKMAKATLPFVARPPVINASVGTPRGIVRKASRG